MTKRIINLFLSISLVFAMISTGMFIAEQYSKTSITASAEEKPTNLGNGWRLSKDIGDLSPNMISSSIVQSSDGSKFFAVLGNDRLSEIFDSNTNPIADLLGQKIVFSNDSLKTQTVYNQNWYSVQINGKDENKLSDKTVATGNSDLSRLYLSDGINNSLYQSTNNGESFQKISQVGSDSNTAVSQLTTNSSGSDIYALVCSKSGATTCGYGADTSRAKLYYSNNYGKSFSDITGSLNLVNADYAYTLKLSPDEKSILIYADGQENGVGSNMSLGAIAKVGQWSSWQIFSTSENSFRHGKGLQTDSNLISFSSDSSKVFAMNYVVDGNNAANSLVYFSVSSCLENSQCGVTEISHFSSPKFPWFVSGDDISYQTTLMTSKNYIYLIGRTAGQTKSGLLIYRASTDNFSKNSNFSQFSAIGSTVLTYSNATAEKLFFSAVAKGVFSLDEAKGAYQHYEFERTTAFSTAYAGNSGTSLLRDVKNLYYSKNSGRSYTPIDSATSPYIKNYGAISKDGKYVAVVYDDAQDDNDAYLNTGFTSIVDIYSGDNKETVQSYTKQSFNLPDLDTSLTLPRGSVNVFEGFSNATFNDGSDLFVIAQYDYSFLIYKINASNPNATPQRIARYDTVGTTHYNNFSINGNNMSFYDFDPYNGTSSNPLNIFYSTNINSDSPDIQSTEYFNSASEGQVDGIETATIGSQLWFYASDYKILNANEGEVRIRRIKGTPKAQNDSGWEDLFTKTYSGNYDSGNTDENSTTQKNKALGSSSKTSTTQKLKALGSSSKTSTQSNIVIPFGISNNGSVLDFADNEGGVLHHWNLENGTYSKDGDGTQLLFYPDWIKDQITDSMTDKEILQLVYQYLNDPGKLEDFIQSWFGSIVTNVAVSPDGTHTTANTEGVNGDALYRLPAGEYTVFFDANDGWDGEGTNLVDPIQVTKGKLVQLPNNNFIAPAGKPYFKCWSLNKNSNCQGEGNYEEGKNFELTKDEDVTLYAIFGDAPSIFPPIPGNPTGAACQVTFDAKGGTMDEIHQSQIVECQLYAKKPPNPTKKGYIFNGWYEQNNPNGTQKTFDFEKTKIVKDITLYAHWVGVKEVTPTKNNYKTNVYIQAKKSLNLNLTAYPDFNEHKGKYEFDLTATSSNTKIATVGAIAQKVKTNTTIKIPVKAIKKGTSNIKVTVGIKTYTYKITVVAKGSTKVKSLSIKGVKTKGKSKNLLTIKDGKPRFLTLNISGAKLLNTVPTWKVLDAKSKRILSLDQSGKLIPLKPNVAKCSVKVNNKTYKFNVKILSPITKITLSSVKDKNHKSVKSITIKKGKTANLNLQTVAQYMLGSSETLSVKLSKKNIIKVSMKGKGKITLLPNVYKPISIKRLKKGAVTLTLTAPNGKNVKITIK